MALLLPCPFCFPPLPPSAAVAAEFLQLLVVVMFPFVASGNFYPFLLLLFVYCVDFRIVTLYDEAVLFVLWQIS